MYRPVSIKGRALSCGRFPASIQQSIELNRYRIATRFEAKLDDAIRMNIRCIVHLKADDRSDQGVPRHGVILGGPVAQVLIHYGKPPNVRDWQCSWWESEAPEVSAVSPKCPASQPNDRNLHARQISGRDRSVQRAGVRPAQDQRLERGVLNRRIQGIGFHFHRGTSRRQVEDGENQQQEDQVHLERYREDEHMNRGRQRPRCLKRKRNGSEAEDQSQKDREKRSRWRRRFFCLK